MRSHIFHIDASQQQFQIQILTRGTVYLEDRGVFLQGHRDGADDTEFWGNAGISH